jgi:hypothetical protein
MLERLRFARRWLVGASLLLGVSVGALTLLHLPAARPWLSWLGARCPARRVSAQEVDVLRHSAIETLRGSAPAPSRPALGLRLEETRQEEVLRWAAERGLRCAAFVQGMSFVSCRDVPAAVLGLGPEEGTVTDLSVAFDARGRLVGVDALRSGLSGSEAAARSTPVLRRLREALGAPTEAQGEWSAGYLGGSALATSFVRYRFRDYLAFVTATHLPTSGVMLREQYLSAAVPGSL